MNSKLPHVGTTIFSVMSKLALENQAINLAQGFPNFKVDERLIALTHETLDEDFHQYAPMPGHPLLLNAIGKLTLSQYQRELKVDQEILITAGATEGIFAAIQALVHANDEVIVLDPAYDCYDPAIVLCCAKAVHIPLSVDFSVNWEAIFNATNPNTKMLIINNPHNPSGKIWGKSDFVQLEKLMQMYPQLLLLSDEVYEYITFEQKHISINQIESVRNRSIIISSFGKTFHITGWKMGYLIAPNELMIEIKKVHQFLVFSVNSVAQVALSKYLNLVKVDELGAFYQEKRDLFKKLLQNSRFKLLPSEGSYFQVADYSAISDLSDVDFVKEMTIKHGVAAIPMSVFNENGKDQKLIRFCFAKDDETLINACELLCKM
jgi:methionine aminotransferase